MSIPIHDAWRRSRLASVAVAGLAGIVAVLACTPVVAVADTESAPILVEDDTSCPAAGSCEDPSCSEPARYSIDAEIVVDLENGGRLWQRGDAKDLDHAQATAYCASLSLGGVTGWRLPDGAESGSIVLRAGGLKGCGVKGYCTPAIDQAAFPDTEVDLYWTSQPYEPGMHFSRSFCDGRSTPYKELDSALHAVRCVHDPLPPA